MPPCADTDRLPLALVWPASTSLPWAVSVRSPAWAAATPRSDTPTPFSVEASRILLAYMPPSWLTSMPLAGPAPSPAIGVALSVPRSTWFAPATTLSWLAYTEALTDTARAIKSTWSTLLAFRPAPCTVIWPPVTRYASRLPLPPNTGTPVVSVARLVLIKPPPLTRMPFGLAITTSARGPATSRYPRSVDGCVLVTWLTMMRAEPPGSRFGLPLT